MDNNVLFKVGTYEEYHALEQKNPNALYWITDTNEIYKGDKLYGSGRYATESSGGLMSAEDKEKLNSLSEGSVAGLVPVDASIVIEQGEDSTKTIGVQISKEPGNIISVKNDGLFVSASNAEYTIEKLGTASEGYAATYRLKKTEGDSSSYVGDEINIPKDMVLQSATIQTVTVADQPYDGAVVGDTYIDMVFNDPEVSHIYLPTKGLIDTSNFVVKQIVNPDGGKAIIENEPTGGGAKYHAPDGSQSFVGVNDGGLGGMMAQIYADKLVDGQWVGSRINVYHDHIYYTSLADKQAGKANNASECEIATKGDVAAVQTSLEGVAESLTWGTI